MYKNNNVRNNWRKFEREVEKICRSHDFETIRNLRFRDEEGWSEIDIVAKRFDITLCIDTKFYSERRYRVGQIKREAKKHFLRCKRYSKLTGNSAVPVIVPYINDGIYSYRSCLIVPFPSFNNFLTEIYFYLSLFNYL